MATVVVRQDALVVDVGSEVSGGRSGVARPANLTDCTAHYELQRNAFLHREIFFWLQVWLL